MACIISSFAATNFFAQVDSFFIASVFDYIYAHKPFHFVHFCIVNFKKMYHKDVDIYIENLPEELQAIADEIREMIFNIVPDVQETFSFKIPFYKYFGMFCYLTTMGKKLELHLSFLRGKDLVTMYPQLEQKGRAMAASICFKSRKEFNKNEIAELITTAAIWQKEAFEQGEGFLKKKKSRNS